MDKIQGFDQGMWNWLQEKHRPLLDVFLAGTSGLAHPLLLTILTAGVAAWLIRLRRIDLSLFLLASLAGGQAISSSVPDLVGRDRPQPRAPLPDLPSLWPAGPQPHWPIKPQGGYPSQFALLATVTLLPLALIAGDLVGKRRGLFLGIGGTLVFLVGISRMYWGFCYPTDVLGAWMAGTAWVLVCRGAWRRWWLRANNQASPPDLLAETQK